MSVYDYIVKDNNGKDVKLSKYEGKVLLIVNTATKCGFTKQYPALQELYKKYKKEGFEILDFPCNQFGGQAKEPIDEILKIREENYGVKFKLDRKGKIAGRFDSRVKPEELDETIEKLLKK